MRLSGGADCPSWGLQAPLFLLLSSVLTGILPKSGDDVMGVRGWCPSLEGEEGPHPQSPEKAPNYNPHNALHHPAPLPRGRRLQCVMGVVVKTGPDGRGTEPGGTRGLK